MNTRTDTSTSTSTPVRLTARSTAALGFALVVAVALSACVAEPVSVESQAASAAADSVVVVDGWVKAVDEGMTAAFGTLENTGETDAVLFAASSSVSSIMELHEVVMSDGAMIMQPKEGGIVIAAGATHELMPGADHLMMMGVSEPLQPGDEVTITLEFSDGSTREHAFTVKEFAGAQEEYVGDMGDE